MPPFPPRNRRDFEIAIICALPLEANCVHAVFDQFWEDDYGKAPGDPNAYTTGVIGDHNVVLAHMPNMGKVSASSVAASLRSSFANVKLALVVGICGGVPQRTDKEEIFLGDVVISEALVQYDFGKQYPEAFEEKNTLEDGLGRPSREIRTMMAKLKTFRYRQKMQDDAGRHLQALQQALPEAQRPDLETDKLFEPLYLHKHRESAMGVLCDACRQGEKQICRIALGMSCDELGCENERLISRWRRPPAQSSKSEEYLPVIHFGKMGSGDTVMKSGQGRDRIANADGIIAFEMEGAGVWDQFSSVVIKGVCDYADSHKNKHWQYYAAATAAACMKAFLRHWTLEDRSNGQG